ncbi:STAS domain-containing protein [Thermomonospora catenispora]|uniref:STAS domain-containing protein n=1 Tax=Thermomonospora catenispora TaxID=2493090 RepID=UPI0013758290|nr:STAS domain-containing protein [Thermomonospora catenispora]
MSTRPQGDWRVIEVRGELDIATVHLLDDQVTAAAAGVRPQIALELSGLGFCDCAGLAGIVRAAKRAAETGGRLMLLRPSRPVSRCLRLTGLDRHLVIADTLAS